MTYPLEKNETTIWFDRHGEIESIQSYCSVTNEWNERPLTGKLLEKSQLLVDRELSENSENYEPDYKKVFEFVFGIN